MCQIYVVHKDGISYPYNDEQLFAKVDYSAARVLKKFTQKERYLISNDLKQLLLNTCEVNPEGDVVIPSSKMHDYVEVVLDRWFPKVAESYRYYRNYREEDKEMWQRLYERGMDIIYRGDKENANADSSLVSTKRCLFAGECRKELYQRFFLFSDEREALRDGYIYVHDQNARLDTMNCCLFDAATVLKNGFEMGNMWYTEPKSLDVAFDVIGDIVLSAASQQYGGFTVPEVDKLLEPYAEKSYVSYFKKYISFGMDECQAEAEAYAEVTREFEQGFQGWEYKFNTVASSRGDYPFITLTFGIGTGKYAVLASSSLLRVRANGQGAKGRKKPVLFPKLVFLYDESLHGSGGLLERLFMEAIHCSQKTMYPDYLSLSGEGYVPSMYQQYGLVISPMGCRAFLSPWYERGGLEPADENDVPVFVGRFNIGVISLNLPMILRKSQVENTDFYKELDYYLELCKRIHLRTYEYLGHFKASCNPLAYCQGGFYGGNLNPEDEISPLLASATASIGVTAGEETQFLYNGKTLIEDGSFFEEVLQYLNNKIVQWKKETGRLFALYGTPAESLCGKQVEQFRKKYGIIQGVSDRSYVSNSFHCHVTSNITQLEKQDYEYRFWDYLNGGKIQYVRYPIDYNVNAIVALVRRAMGMGYYEGVNLALSFCNSCGYRSVTMDVEESCPHCGSGDITRIDRMNGYLSITTLHGTEDSGRLNRAKTDEIRERVSM